MSMKQDVKAEKNVKWGELNKKKTKKEKLDEKHRQSLEASR